MRYFIIHAGYDINPADDGFTSYEIAIAELRAVAKNSLIKAGGKYKSARLHKISNTKYLITLGADERSMLYASHRLITG